MQAYHETVDAVARCILDHLRAGGRPRTVTQLRKSVSQDIIRDTGISNGIVLTALDRLAAHGMVAPVGGMDGRWGALALWDVTDEGMAA